jgi:hypothetical protein
MNTVSNSKMEQQTKGSLELDPEFNGQAAELTNPQIATFSKEEKFKAT